MNWNHCDGYAHAALTSAAETSVREQRTVMINDRGKLAVYARSLYDACEDYDPRTRTYRGRDDDGDAWAIQLPDIGDRDDELACEGDYRHDVERESED